MNAADHVIRHSTPRGSTDDDAHADGSRTDDAGELRRRVDGDRDVFGDVIVIHRWCKADASATRRP